MFVVQKKPIKVIDLSLLDPQSKEGNIDNYSEATYRKLETVPMQYSYPMGVKTYSDTPIIDKYLQWQGGDVDNGALVENLNKTMVDNDILAKNKVAKYLEIREAAENEVDNILAAAKIKTSYILGFIFLKNFTDSMQEWFTPEQKLELKVILEASFTKLQTKFTEIALANSTNIADVVW